jgi:putative nucleotidyltransferase with HDIG domain
LQFTRTMAQTLDARDHATAGHSSRVSAYATQIAKVLPMTDREREVVEVGAVLHDIGKIGIPDRVLQKEGRLTDEEFETIKEHPVLGRRILEGVSRFRDYLSIVELHHENHDGSGYPWGLSGENIPLGARIVHVVDAFDAMTSCRPYRNAMPTEQALAILKKYAGTQFDPVIVEVFLELVRSDPGMLPPATVEPASPLQLARAIQQEQEEVPVQELHQ